MNNGRPMLAVLAAATLAIAGAAGSPPPARAATATPTCANTVGGSQSQPAPGAPCWVDTQPYPFGSNGTAVATVGDAGLYVTSLAFRAWNRGLAATAPASGLTTPYGVWLYDGSTWRPNPTFPGNGVCPGNVVLWAGKLDYWLIGGSAQGGRGNVLCRYDGSSRQWEPLAIPAATLAISNIFSINAGSCLAWNNCWFFGDYGAVVHWNGTQLSDATPDTAGQPWLSGEYEAAATQTDLSGNPFGFAVSASRSWARDPFPLPVQPDGSPPAQLFQVGASGPTPLPYSPPATGPVGDPYQTDLAAVAFNPTGQGWVAGNPRGYAEHVTPSATVSALLAPITTLGTSGAAQCPTGSQSFSGYLWPEQSFDTDNSSSGDTNVGGDSLGSALSVFPAPTSTAAVQSPAAPLGGDALAGAEDANGNAVVIDASCKRAPIFTTFESGSPGYGVSSVAANAVNDAWAATENEFNQYGRVGGSPHLYHLTDSSAPLAPAGDDVEPRPHVFQQDPTIFVVSPPAPSAPPPPVVTNTTSSQTSHVTVQSPIYDVKSRIATVHGHITLYLTFKVRASVALGLEALRGRKRVGYAPIRRFSGKTGTLSLRLSRSAWPTKLRFLYPRGALGSGSS